MKEYDIGRKLKTLRLEKKMTLKDMATRIGCSVALLSQIENNNISPPITTLSRLTKALEVKIGSLFDDEESKYFVMRKDEKKSVSEYFPTLEKKVAHFCEPHFSKMRNMKMTPYLITLSGDSQGSMGGKQGESFIYVIKGRFEMSLDSRELTLEEGDSIYFDTTMAHGYRSREGSEATILEVRTTA
jgi:transcriptional regulator with XRE-family HTH domain